MRVFITGGTGLVGGQLVKRLRERGDQVVALSRQPDAASKLGDGVTVVTGDPTQQGPWMDAVAGCDAVVHLAGEGIFNRRWSQEFKDLIYSSRIKGTENIVAAFGKAPVADTSGSSSSSPPPPGGEGPLVKGRVLINASAVGYYGPHGDEELTEASL